jgi:hypothetical protein
MQKKHLSWALLVDHAATAWQPYYVLPLCGWRLLESHMFSFGK